MQSIGVTVIGSTGTTINGASLSGLDIGVEIINSHGTKVLDSDFLSVGTAIKGYRADGLVVSNVRHIPFERRFSSLSTSIWEAIYGNV